MSKDYVYYMPKGYTWPSEVREKFDNLVEKLKLTNIQAQEILNLHVEMMDEYAEEYAKAKAEE